MGKFGGRKETKRDERTVRASGRVRGQAHDSPGWQPLTLCVKKVVAGNQCPMLTVLALLAMLVACNEALTPRVMPWMCLQRCNETVEDIEANLAQLKALRPCLAAVSFERYNLGANGTLVLNSDLYPVGPRVAALGLETWPMISSYPYPPQFLSWMRQLWSDSDANARFVASLRTEAAAHGWTGYQVDWEPTATATPDDAAEYAHYLADLSARMAPTLIRPTVASWNAIWNLTALSEAGLSVITMGTYATNLTTFAHQLNAAALAFPAARLGVGLENWPDMDGDIALDRKSVV